MPTPRQGLSPAVRELDFVEKPNSETGYRDKDCHRRREYRHSIATQDEMARKVRWLCSHVASAHCSPGSRKRASTPRVYEAACVFSNCIAGRHRRSFCIAEAAVLSPRNYTEWPTISQSHASRYIKQLCSILLQGEPTH